MSHLISTYREAVHQAERRSVETGHAVYVIPVRAYRISDDIAGAASVSDSEVIRPPQTFTLPGRTGVLFAAFLLPLLFGTGCTSTRILSSANNWAFYAARVNESCVNPVPPCPCRHAALERWRTALDEANAAMKRGGRMPLQVKALKAWEAAYEECK